MIFMMSPLSCEDATLTCAVLQSGFLGFMAGNASRKNGEKGGRPPGRKNDATLEREAQLERFRQRVFEAFDPLVNAQIAMARGLSYLFKADTDGEGKARKPILVTDPEEIAAFLADDYNELETTYYYITTEKPDNRAIDSLLDRATGKAAQVLELPPDSDLGMVTGFIFQRNENSNAGNPAHS
jgi:hypothetical protein